MKEFNCYNTRACDIIKDIIRFTRLEPKLPPSDKKFARGAAIELSTDMTREEIVAHLESRRSNPVIDLAFYAFRDLSRTDWAPFLKAALQRSPVSIKGLEERSNEQVIEILGGLPNESIYDGARMAQPDEVWNYKRGDGLERAVCLANIWKARRPDDAVEIRAGDGRVGIRLGSRSLTWPTAKGLDRALTL
jgi:hypothetical protein